MKKIFLLFFLIFPSIVFSQINDDFEDGNLDGWTENIPGHWAASPTDPISGIYSLKHNLDDVSGISYITHPISGISLEDGVTVWMFNMKNGNWDPSGSNFFGFFLFSNSEDLTSDLNAYVAGINFSGTTDLLSLWKVTGGSYSNIIESSFDWNESETIGIRISRSAIGEWSLEYDTDGGFDNLIPGGTATDNEHTEAFYTGAYFEYTSTRAGEFWFDDFSLTGPPDTDPPVILDIEAISNTSILVNFNEELDETSAENPNYYFVDGGVGSPVSSVLNPIDNTQVELIFTNSFSDETVYTLEVNNVEDLNGNACVSETGTFSYLQIAVSSAFPVSSTELDVYFNKDPNASSAENLSNYFVNNGIGNPTSASVDGDDNSIVHLSFSTPFVLEQLYTLTVQNVEDEYGNSIETTNIDFSYYEVQAFDLVINEIMCDVNPPPEALPVHEYLEIYNNSSYEINLNEWTLQIGDNTERAFPGIILPVDEYAIICEDDAESEFSPFGITVPILNPSELTVSGKRLIIRNNLGDIIEDITYSDEWYDDDEKDDGGFSIERIDPLNFCGEDENWTATNDFTGGTPGRENSVYDINPDLSAPVVMSIEYISSKQVNIHFSENIDSQLAENPNNYLLNSSINPESANISSETSTIVLLSFQDNFNEGSNSLNIQNIEDNCTNMMDEFNGSFEYQLIYPVTADVVSANQIRVLFSEKPDLSTAQNPMNYLVNKDIGNPTVAIISNTDSSVINLLFDSDFILEETYILNIENIEDINQNVMNTANIEFVYYIPIAFDIVFTEIMADINPEPVGLPAYRYIEIYNTSEYALNLADWVFLAEGQTEKTFPYMKIEANDYVILCEEAAETDFLQYGVSAPILSSSDITVSGKNLKLFNPEGVIISEITYSDDWYDDPEKDDGGWSLEIIDPLNFCGENDNWTASEDISGGTPGRINSVNDENPDNIAPELSDLEIIASNYLLLEFNENISYVSGGNISNFSVNNSIGNPYLSYTDGSDRKFVHLLFSDEFQDGESYNLITENIQDNCDNTIQTTGFEFSYLRIYPETLYVEGENSLKINFSESVDLESGTNILNYNCDMGIGNPVYAFRETADTSVIHIQFENPFPSGEVLTLSIQNIEDINGNTMHTAEISFTYYIPVFNDIVINEVLFNPFKDGSDFVELYNRSEFKIDLKDLYLASRDDSDSIISYSRLSETDFIIDPQTYLAFTLNRDSVMRDYMSLNQENIIEIGNMPSFNDEEGTVVLIHENDSVIDEFTYHEDMHFDLLDDVEGVSLEKVSFLKSSQDLSNWHSASEFVGFATPAYQNSQYAEFSDLFFDPVNVEPFVFSPDNDGFDDYLNINYDFSDQGNTATVIIFDSKGRPVEELANNMTLSTKGTFVWDGLYQDNRQAPAGTYLVYFKLFNLNGSAQVYKKTFVLAKRI